MIRYFGQVACQVKGSWTDSNVQSLLQSADKKDLFQQSKSTSAKKQYSAGGCCVRDRLLMKCYSDSLPPGKKVFSSCRDLQPKSSEATKSFLHQATCHLPASPAAFSTWRKEFGSIHSAFHPLI